MCLTLNWIAIQPRPPWLELFLLLRIRLAKTTCMHELFAIAFSYMNCVVMGSKFINFISGVVCLRDKEFYFVLTHTENCLAQTSRRHIYM